jgi:ABC-2 type transport system permease protein
MRRTFLQTRSEVSLVVRNGEQLLLTLVIPVLLLVFFSVVDVLPSGTQEPVDFLLPGIVALAVMSTSMVSLGIATGFERTYTVLKRLGATPLTRGELVAAKMLSVGAVEVLQLVILVPLGVLLGWQTGGGTAILALPAVLLGTAAFSGIGLTLAGTLRGEINLAAQNGLYLVLLLLGGMVIPMSSLPGPLRTVCEYLPSSARDARLAHRCRQPARLVVGGARRVGGGRARHRGPHVPLALTKRLGFPDSGTPGHDGDCVAVELGITHHAPAHRLVPRDPVLGVEPQGSVGAPHHRTDECFADPVTALGRLHPHRRQPRSGLVRSGQLVVEHHRCGAHRNPVHGRDESVRCTGTGAVGLGPHLQVPLNRVVGEEVRPPVHEPTGHQSTELRIRRHVGDDEIPVHAEV